MINATGVPFPFSPTSPLWFCFTRILQDIYFHFTAALMSDLLLLFILVFSNKRGYICRKKNAAVNLLTLNSNTALLPLLYATEDPNKCSFRLPAGEGFSIWPKRTLHEAQTEAQLGPDHLR